MTPYYLLTRDPHLYQQLARDLNRYSKINTHLQDRAPHKRPSLTMSQLISETAYRAVSGIEHLWNRGSAWRGK